MNKRQQRLHIDSGGSHQGIDQQNILIEQSGTLQLPDLVSGKAADQRKAVGMNAGGSEATKHVSVRDPGCGQGWLPLNRTDAEARKIIIARRIPPGRASGRKRVSETVKN